MAQGRGSVLFAFYQSENCSKVRTKHFYEKCLSVIVQLIYLTFWEILQILEDKFMWTYISV